MSTRILLAVSKLGAHDCDIGWYSFFPLGTPHALFIPSPNLPQNKKNIKEILNSFRIAGAAVALVTRRAKFPVPKSYCVFISLPLPGPYFFEGTSGWRTYPESEDFCFNLFGAYATLVKLETESEFIAFSDIQSHYADLNPFVGYWIGLFV